MNKFIFYTVAAVLASSMALSSCGDSFLNSDPASKGAAGAAGDPMNINSGLAAATRFFYLIRMQVVLMSLLFISVTSRVMTCGKVVVMLKMAWLA